MELSKSTAYSRIQKLVFSHPITCFFFNNLKYIINNFSLSSHLLYNKNLFISFLFYVQFLLAHDTDTHIYILILIVELPIFLYNQCVIKTLKVDNEKVNKLFIYNSKPICPYFTPLHHNIKV